MAKALIADPQRSDRSIAKSVGGSHSTVADVRRGLESSGQIDHRLDRSEVAKQAGSGQSANLLRQTPGEPSPALTHGAYAESRLAPMRERCAAELLLRYSFLGEQPLRLDGLADLFARRTLARAWVDEHGLVRNRHGDVFAIVDRLEQWSKRAQDELTRLDAEKREAEAVGRSEALDAHLEELESR